MRSFVIWTAVFAITAGSCAAAHAEDKNDGAAPAVAAAKESAPAEAAPAPAQVDEKAPVDEKKGEAPAPSEPAKQKPAKEAFRELNPNNPWSKKVNAQASALAKALND